MDVTLHIFHVEICIWVWEKCKTPLVKSNLLSHYWNKQVFTNNPLSKHDTQNFSTLKISSISILEKFSILSMVLYLCKYFIIPKIGIWKKSN